MPKDVQRVLNNCRELTDDLWRGGQRKFREERAFGMCFKDWAVDPSESRKNIPSCPILTQKI